MTRKHSEANVRRWRDVPKSERRKRMSALKKNYWDSAPKSVREKLSDSFSKGVKKFWASMTAEQRKEFVRKRSIARQKVK